MPPGRVRAAVEHPLGEVVHPVAVGAGVLEQILHGVLDPFRGDPEGRPARGLHGL